MIDDLGGIPRSMATGFITLSRSRRDRMDVYPVRRFRRRDIKVPVGGLLAAWIKMRMVFGVIGKRHHRPFTWRTALMISA